MRIVLLDYTDNSVTVLPMTKEVIDKYNGDEWYDVAEYITERGFDTGNCNWMVAEEDDIPVYWDKESIPYTSI